MACSQFHAQKKSARRACSATTPARPASESNLRRKKSRKSGCSRYSSPPASAASVMKTLRLTSDGKIVEQPESGYSRTGVQLDALQQREAEQQFLRRRRLKIEDLLGEVIEDVVLGPTQYFAQIGRGLPPWIGAATPDG